MIWELEKLFEHETKAFINNKWVPARPINYKYRSFKKKVKEAWAVFIGKAEAFKWPENQ